MASASSEPWEPSELVLLLYKTERPPGTGDQAGHSALSELTAAEMLVAVTVALTDVREDRELAEWGPPSRQGQPGTGRRSDSRGRSRQGLRTAMAAGDSLAESRHRRRSAHSVPVAV